MRRIPPRELLEAKTSPDQVKAELAAAVEARKQHEKDLKRRLAPGGSAASKAWAVELKKLNAKETLLEKKLAALIGKSKAEAYFNKLQWGDED